MSLDNSGSESAGTPQQYPAEWAKYDAMEATITIEKVREQAAEHVYNITNAWDVVHTINQRHGALIQKRWAKRSRKRRVDFLQSVCPHMAALHRPDFVAAVRESPARESPATRAADTSFRDSYLLPSLNLEDLSQPEVLPLFFDARANTKPREFAAADFHACHIGRASGAIVPSFISRYTMVFTDAPDLYGYIRLIDWTERPEAFEWLLTDSGSMLAGEGLIVLEIQERILDFLYEFAYKLLNSPTNDELLWDELPAPTQPLPTQEVVEGLDMLAVMVAEAPYRSPAVPDFERFQSLFDARKAAAEDHLWSLREDPAYFRATLLRHMEGLLYDSDLGNVRKGFSAVRHNAICTVLDYAHRDCEIWNILHSQVIKACALDAQAPPADEDPALREKCTQTVLELLFTLLLSLKEHIARLTEWIFPKNATLLKTTPQYPDPFGSLSRISKWKIPGLDKHGLELLWVLFMLQRFQENGHAWRVVWIIQFVDELHTLSKREQTVRNLISPAALQHVEDALIAAEGVRQLALRLPWAETFLDLFVKRREELEDTLMGFSLKTVLEESDDEKLTGLARSLEPKNCYPAEKRRTKENVAAMRAAEEHLDEFWSIVEQMMKKGLGSKLEESAAWDVLSQPRVLDRTPEWVEPETRHAKQLKNQDFAALHQPLSNLSLDFNPQPKRSLNDSPALKVPKTKVKTRGTPAPPSDEEENAPLQAAPVPDDVPKIYIDARALKVFQALFHTPDVSGTRGEIAWKDFLHAMLSTGFNVQKLWGSAWQFYPSKLDADKNIQFHEPHPHPKLPYTEARRYGRRLAHTYGWSGESFELLEKDSR